MYHLLHCNLCFSRASKSITRKEQFSSTIFYWFAFCRRLFSLILRNKFKNHKRQFERARFQLSNDISFVKIGP